MKNFNLKLVKLKHVFDLYTNFSNAQTIHLNSQQENIIVGLITIENLSHNNFLIEDFSSA